MTDVNAQLEAHSLTYLFTRQVRRQLWLGRGSKEAAFSFGDMQVKTDRNRTAVSRPGVVGNSGAWRSGARQAQGSTTAAELD